MTKFDELLEELYACAESRVWARGKDFTEIWPVRIAEFCLSNVR
jgi:hypothetical protein